MAQEEFGGWLDVPVMDYVASVLKIEPIEVYEVASFYSMYNLSPVGKYMFEVCQTGPCMVNGSDDIITYIKEKLNIGVGETTADGMFTLKTVECLGACGYAPMMQLGKIYREHLTKRKSRCHHCRMQGKSKLMGITSAILKIKEHRKSEKIAEVNFLVDSGAVYSLVPGKILDELDIEPIPGNEFFTSRWNNIKTQRMQCLF